jgi:hypothetical protein
MMRKGNYPNFRFGKYLKQTVESIQLVTMASCGGDDGDDSGGNPSVITVHEGRFLDSAVKGVQYTSGSQSGVTDANGTFKYETGNSVRFFLGDVTLGEVSGKSIITPVDLGITGKITDTTTINISRFLMTLDEDGNPNNGINIPSQATKLTGIFVNFGSSNFVDTASIFIGQATNTSCCVSSSQAQTHLQKTLDEISGEGD